MRRSRWVPTLLVSSIGLATAAGIYAIRSHPLRLEPGSAAWGRLVMGATPGGAVHEHAALSLPGLDRSSANHLLLRVDAPGSALGISFDQGVVHSIRTDRSGVTTVEMPRAEVPGARVDLFRIDGEPPIRIRALSVTRTARPSVWWLATLAAGAGLISALTMTWRERRVGAALGCAAAALLTVFSTPALIFLSATEPHSLPLFMIPAAWLGVSLAVAHAAPADRGFYWKAVACLTAAVFGCWVRWTFLPSSGSWDTEYWKAWMMRAASHGVTRVYGDADGVAEGHFLAQLSGKEELWRVPYYGRDFVVDYPPLAMAIWRGSWWVVSTLMPWWNTAEAQNVAVKLPSVVGDIIAVVVLFVALRRRPGRALALAILYWALPISWLSSAVLGFLDGAYAPLAVLALLAAGWTRAHFSGGLLASAALIKPQAVIVAPAAAVAVYLRRGGLLRSVVTGLGVVGLALLPFYAVGTLSEAVVHVFRILNQQRLSAGFANPWWIVGHLAGGMRGAVESLTQPVGFTAVGAVSFPARAIALASFALATIWICRCQRRFVGAGPACLAGASIFLSYSILAIGVHHNHPHLVFLALGATGLPSRRLQILTGALSASYVLNMLLLSGLGRFYGSRHLILEPLNHAILGMRMSFGFDLTLALAVLNTVLFVLLLLRLPKELGADRTP